MKFFPRTSSRGFTLIELLVVIFIIGLLASIVVVSVNAARAKSRDARRIADIATVRNAIEMYADANGQYPAQPASNSSCVAATAWVTTTNLVPAYLSVLPRDPRNVSLFCYVYLTINANQDYKVYAGDMESSDGDTRALQDGGTNALSGTRYELFSSGGSAL